MPINDSIQAQTNLTTSPVDTTRPAAVETVRALSPVVDKSDSTNVDTVSMDTVRTHVAVKKTTKPIKVIEVVEPPAWESGLEPTARPGHAGHDQGIVASIVFIMLAAALSFQAVRRVLTNMVKRLSDNRVRAGFETETGLEKRTTLLLLLLTVVFISILTTAGLTIALPGQYMVDMTTTTKTTGIIATYFLFQYAVYQTLGYTFSSDEGRILWVRGFTASMTLLGIGLIIPGLVVLFYPALTLQAVWIGAGLYVIARVMFISRGFRIFYTNIASLIYFILYLCSLEIIPICVIFYVSTQILQY